MFTKSVEMVILLIVSLMFFQSCDHHDTYIIPFIDPGTQVDILFVSESQGSQRIFAVQDTVFGEVLNVSYSYFNYTNGILDPTWFRDGHKFAFTDIYIMTSLGFPYHSNIYILNMDSLITGHTLRPVTYNQFWVDSNGVHGTLNLRPDWSLYTDQIVFISNRDSVFNIYVTDITDTLTGDTLPTALTTESDKIEIFCYPSFSPDGSKILYTSKKSGNEEIWMMNADGTNKTQLTHNNASINSRPRFSPSADRISFFSNMWVNGNDSLQIYTMDPNGTNLDTVTTSGNNKHPAWSPDGTEIIYAKRGGTASRPRSYIHIIGRNGLNERKLISGDSKAYYPTWRPQP